MKNEKGITMMNLVVTIIVMVILISVAGFYSIDSIKNSYIANEKKELADVIEYVATLKTQLLIDEFSLSDDTVISQTLLDKYENILTANQINKILEVNISTLNANYKYHYIDSEKLADKAFSGGKVNVKDAKNNYIINFYTGTIIALYDSKSEISGSVKGLTDILLDVNGEI